MSCSDPSCTDHQSSSLPGYEVSQPQLHQFQLNPHPVHYPTPAFITRRPLRHHAQAQPQTQLAPQSEPRSYRLPSGPPPSSTPSSPSAPPRVSGSRPLSALAPRQAVRTQPRLLAPLKTRLDTAFRVSAERIRAELSTLHTYCVRMISREQQEKELFRTHCLKLKGERDVARERMQVFMGAGYENGTGVRVGIAAGSDGNETRDETIGVKRGRDDWFTGAVRRIPTNPALSPPRSVSPTAGAENEDDSNEVHNLLYPPSSTSPSPHSPPPTEEPASMLTVQPAPQRMQTSHIPQTPGPRDPPTGSKRPRSASPALPTQVAPAVSPPPLSDVLLPHSKRRRTSASSGSSRRSSASDRTLVAVERVKDKGESVDMGEADMDLESDVELSIVDDVARRSVSRFGSGSPELETAKAVPAAVDLQRQNIDLMYVTTKSQLVCRPCSYRRSQSGVPSAPPPTSFAYSASWRELAAHCEKDHPTVCADLAALGPGQVMELRRRVVRRRSA